MVPLETQLSQESVLWAVVVPLLDSHWDSSGGLLGGMAGWDTSSSKNTVKSALEIQSDPSVVSVSLGVCEY